jgi:Tfp pilus assembly protein PilF
MNDIFAIQDEISQAISEALKVRLAPRAQVVNIEAYQNYLKGQYYLQRVTPESLEKAKECFELALAIDPNYAPAYSGLAVYYYGLGVLSIKPMRDMAPLARSAAEKALAIDPSNREARGILAVLAAMVDYDWSAAEAHLRQAMAAEPIPPAVRTRYAVWYLLPLGRIPEATEQSRLALETDPLSMVTHVGMSMCLFGAKQYRETIEYVCKALEIDANYWPIWGAIGWAQLHAGFAQAAITSSQRSVELAPWYSELVWWLAVSYHKAGDIERSQEWALKLSDAHGQTYAASAYYAAVGEVDAMFDALDGAYRERQPPLLFLPNEPLFDPYRADPRFQAVLQRMNLA